MVVAMYLVAFLGSTAASRRETTTSSTLSSRVCAVAGNMARLTALVAGLVLRTLWALTAHMSLTSAVVAVMY